MTVFLAGTVIAIWLGFGAAMPIDKAITLVYSIKSILSHII
jgi:hypothetical protein